MGILVFFVIIAVLSIFSAITMSRLATKTGAILKENHVSVVYARDMSAGLLKINQEITTSFLKNTKPDSLAIRQALDSFTRVLELEKNNLTEAGEDHLVAEIEAGFIGYRDSVLTIMNASKPAPGILFLQMKSENLYRQLTLLSEINGKAIEHKTDDAGITANHAWKQMTVLATLCFLITLSFAFRFASYFNERFFQLYHGINEIVASNYGQRLYFEGNDEFHDISLVFNKMAEKLNENSQNIVIPVPANPANDPTFNELQELKGLLARLKVIEEQSNKLITRLENRK